MSGNKNEVYAVLLAGGSGTRLWPISRELHPKQLARFLGDYSLIQQTVLRLIPEFDTDNIRVVCGQTHSMQIVQDLEAIKIKGNGKVIHEPCGKNTAPAVLLAINRILASTPDAIIFIFPSDHVIGNVPSFHKIIKNALVLAKKDYIVTFGITPAYPETGYGYIEASKKKAGKGFMIERFVEKPDLKTAKSYLKAGNFFWNSGMFAFKASIMLDEFKRFKPEMTSMLKTMANQYLYDIPSEIYQKLDNISLDYAIMEHTEKGVVLPSDFGWSDIGSWKSLYDYLPKNSEGNVISSNNIMINNTKNSLVIGNDRLVALNKVENIVVIDTPDALFVSDLESSREVKKIVDSLNYAGRKECRYHQTISYYWGYEKTLEEMTDKTIKRIVISPKHSMPIENKTIGKRIYFILEGAVLLERENDSVRFDKSQSFVIDNASIYSTISNILSTPLELLEIYYSVSD